MKGSNILITGGAGFIGSHLAIELIKLGNNVTVLDSLTTQIHGNMPQESPLFKSIKDKVKFIHGDVCERADWETSLSGQDAVIHLAAETGTGQSMYEIERYVKTNVTGTALLWDIIANTKNSIKKVIVASSRAIYGEGSYMCNVDGIVYPALREDRYMKQGDFKVKCPICNNDVQLLATTEDSKIHPTSIYGFTKQAQEEMSMLAGKSLHIPVVSFRYQNVYGPGQSLSNPYTGILSIFSTRINNGNEILVFEDGKESRDFVYIDDVVEATILGLENSQADFQCFNVGSGERTDVLTLAKRLKESYDSNVDISVTGNYRIGDIRHNYADLSKIKSFINYKPKIKFETGISNFTKWVKNQEIVADGFQDSIQEMKQRGMYK